MSVNVRYEVETFYFGISGNFEFPIFDFRQVQYDASVDIYLTSKTIHDARPGVWSSPENILALYKAVEVFVGQKQNQNGKMMP